MFFYDYLYNKLLTKYYNVKIGNNFTCIGRMIIQGHGTYHLGNHVTINSKMTVNPIGGNKTVLQTIGSGKIIIGNHVGMSHAILCSRSEIKIEDHVMIGSGVKIFDHDFHSLQYEERIKEKDRNVQTKAVLIKEGAFIGAHAIILKGVTIGRHSIIGAGAVVTKDIPDGEIWGGNPAVFLRQIENKTVQPQNQHDHP